MIKKTVLLLSVFLSLYANKNNCEEIYKAKTKKILSYSINMPNTAVFPPFYNYYFKQKQQKIKNVKVVKVSYKIIPLSILLNNAYVKIQKFKGDQLMKEEKRWIKINDKIGNCKVQNIKNTFILLNCGNHLIKESISNNQLFQNLKERN
jgi:hypothetical protein